LPFFVIRLHEVGAVPLGEEGLEAFGLEVSLGELKLRTLSRSVDSLTMISLPGNGVVW
jgi:hypothetical protein